MVHLDPPCPWPPNQCRPSTHHTPVSLERSHMVITVTMAITETTTNTSASAVNVDITQTPGRCRGPAMRPTALPMSGVPTPSLAMPTPHHRNTTATTHTALHALTVTSYNLIFTSCLPNANTQVKLSESMSTTTIRGSKVFILAIWKFDTLPSVAAYFMLVKIYWKHDKI